jgi:hypothetical protein
MFEKRQSDTIRLLTASNSLSADKIAISNRFQRTEKYFNVKYFSFETPIISALRNMPLKSIFFYPETLQTENFHEYQIPITLQNTRYFSFSDTEYTVLNEPLIPRKLIMDIICDTDSTVVQNNITRYTPTAHWYFPFYNLYPQRREVLSGKTATYTGNGIQYAIYFSLARLKQSDSVEVSVWRKGSESGFLVVSDYNNPAKIWYPQQTTSEPNEKGWQKLSTTFIITEKTPLKTFVWNSNYEKELIYFDDFHVRVWRE